MGQLHESKQEGNDYTRIKIILLFRCSLKLWIATFALKFIFLNFEKGSWRQFGAVFLPLKPYGWEN